MEAHRAMPLAGAVPVQDAGRALLDRIQRNFIGVSREYRLADGTIKRQRYIDSAATTLMLNVAHDVVEQYLEHYSNSHSQSHFGSRIAIDVLEWVRERCLSLLEADPNEYTCLFVGNGTTAAINKVARILRIGRPSHDIVLVSSMEHHSNDLPHRLAFPTVVHVPLQQDAQGRLGAVDLNALEKLLQQHAGNVAYVAITAASNVTGIINPISAIVEIAHRHGALVVADAAQALPRRRISLRDSGSCAGVDAIAFSGHKMYAPGSPGVLVVRKSLIANRELDEVGGGVVTSVYKDMFVPLETLPDREESGTPNITGALALGCAMDVFARIGIDVIAEHEDTLLKMLWTRLAAMDQVEIYGSHDLDRFPRVGVASFNVRKIEHGLVTAILNDYHNVALRSGCFCAQPYVRELLQHDIWNMDCDDEQAIMLRLGMVRASFGIYSCVDDIDSLVAGIEDVQRNEAKYRKLYRVNDQATFEHVSFRADTANQFTPTTAVSHFLGRCG